MRTAGLLTRTRGVAVSVGKAERMVSERMACLREVEARS
jgi:hypothetical protein